jgi:hypothetical protein
MRCGFNENIASGFKFDVILPKVGVGVVVRVGLIVPAI